MPITGSGWRVEANGPQITSSRRKSPGHEVDASGALAQRRCERPAQRHRRARRSADPRGHDEGRAVRDHGDRRVEQERRADVEGFVRRGLVGRHLHERVDDGVAEDATGEQHDQAHQHQAPADGSHGDAAPSLRHPHREQEQPDREQRQHDRRDP